ncbi:MAG: DNA-protecting protein DprA, partial [Proteobacteria bacterium]|nr:DNA-protecting protein DprA [Pseudomonadota bacterium]
RNYTLSGISLASVIVEAGETSGTLIQARMCINQGRHLFLLKNLMENKDLTWPEKYVRKGAFVLDSIEDVPAALARIPEYKGARKENTLFE